MKRKIPVLPSISCACYITENKPSVLVVAGPMSCMVWYSDQPAMCLCSSGSNRENKPWMHFFSVVDID